MLNTLLLLAFMLFSQLAFAQKAKRDTIQVSVFYADTSLSGNHAVQCGKVLEVIEWHNTADGVADPGACSGCEWKDYAVHIKFLTLQKREIYKGFLLFKPYKNNE